MVTKVDLISGPTGGAPSMIDIRQFIGNITDLAYVDYLNGNKTKRSGSELCDMFTTNCRRGHVRMASGLYNKIRWTLDTNWDG